MLRNSVPSQDLWKMEGGGKELLLLLLLLQQFNRNKNYHRHIQFRGNEYSEGVTCRLLRGSIFMTGPTVLRGRATSILWFGLRGVRTWSGPAGARPKLQRNTEGGNSVTNCENIYKSQHIAYQVRWLPVSVKLDGKISHDTHSFITEGHLHLDDPSTAGKSA